MSEKAGRSALHLTLLVTALATAFSFWLRASLAPDPVESAAILAGWAPAPSAAGSTDDEPLRELLDQGDELRRQDEVRSALAAFDEALGKAEATGNEKIMADALLGLGRVYGDLGDYYRVLDAFTRARELYRQLGDVHGEAEALYGLGTSYSFLGQFTIARDDLQAALEKFPRAYGKSIALTAIATLHDLEGEHDEAIQRFREVLVLRHQIRGVDERTKLRGKASTLDRLASAYAEESRLAEARRAYESALQIQLDAGLDRDRAITTGNLGWLALDEEDPEAAMGYFRQALHLLQGTANPHSEALSLQGMSLAYRRLGDLAAAGDHLEQAIRIIESLRSTSYSQSLRSSFLARRRPFYESYVDLLMARHRLSPGEGFVARALSAAESFKARSLLDLLNEERDALRAGADEALLRDEERLYLEMNAKDHERLLLLQSEGSSARLARVEKEQRELSWEYDRLQEQLRASASEPRSVPPVSAERMRQLLDPETRLLVYSLGEDESFLWLVSPDRVEAFQLPPRDEIEALAQDVYDWLETSDQRGDARPGRAAAAQLSKILLGPVQRELAEKRLLVVPAGRLHYIPFAALPTPGGAVDSALIDDHEVVTLPSVSVLSFLRDRTAGRQPASKLLAVLADPVFGRTDERLAASNADPGPAGELRSATSLLPPTRLKFSNGEADAILAFAPPGEGVTAKGFDASRRALLDGAFSDFRILHLAVHGELNDQQPEFSHLVLSLFEETGEPADGRLYLHEIDDLDLPAELVVLSACNTALGKHVDGEGLIAMTRGFMYAGAARVLVSLWYVDDEATAKLMEHFYRELLQEDRAPAAALQSAQRALRETEEWSAPYHWAGFVLQGDWRWEAPE